ncbi:hypothetical protein AKJ09_02301 [Labilithrix luteola]|uniref:IgGFc-binding protein N-terminal domain-containing protein n=1 Tax=Labilithrix luteola TaxID=1391654 RepID=A0A0K1PQ34_9BACT|nr:hypothetical protein AKJ09_02301 [Labilithrix luteola]
MFVAPLFALLVGFIVSATGACNDERAGFAEQQQPVFTDAGGTVDAAPAAPCPLQCSLDGRSVIRSCTGEVVETCADNLACGEARCQEPCAAAAADRSSNGCDFYFASPRFTKLLPQSCHATFVVNSSNQPATLSLEYGGKAFDLTHAVYRVVPNSTDLEPLQGPIAPGESAVVFVSDRDQHKSRTPAEKDNYIRCPYGVTAAVETDINVFNSAIGHAFRMTSNVPVSLTTIYPYGGAASYVPSATLVLPVSTWAKEHVIVDGWEANTGVPATQIYASEDDTEVTIIGKKDIANGIGFTGAAAGTPTKIHLAKGQYAQIVQSQELTGSFVLSNKPTVTLGGNECADIPNGVGACDTLAQQIPPYEQWGSEYVGVGYRPRVAGTEESVWYRMVAARDGTDLEYDPVKPDGAPISMSAGQLALFRARTNEPFVVRSRDPEHPFYLGIHMSGGDTPGYGGQGDPDFVNVVPAGQFMNSYSFYADSTYAENSLVIVRRKTNGEFKDVWLECAGNLPTFKPVDSRGEYEYTRVDLSRRFGPGDQFGDKQCITGLQRMRSDGAFSATLWGWSTYASYGYPGGMALRKLVETPLAPVK